MLSLKELEMNKSTYNNYRHKLGLEYITFLRVQYDFDDKNFFNPRRLESFISTKPNKNKKLIVTHMSEFTKMVDGFMSNDIRKPTIDKSYSLKSNPRFAKFLPGKKSKSQNAENFVFFNVKCLEKLLKIHSHSSHCTTDLEACRLLFIALVGCRPESTLDLANNSSLSKKLCYQCANSDRCRYYTPDCFPQVNIHKTKTHASHSVPLLSAVQKCYFALKSSPGNTSLFKEKHMNSLNEFCVMHFDMTAHKARKFLPNLLSSNVSHSNTGAWTNNQTLQRFYLSPMYKFLLAEKLVDEILFS